MPGTHTDAFSAQASPKTLEAHDFRADIEELGPWFHNLHLPDGRETAPDHPYGDFPRFKWQHIAPRLPDDLRGWSVLDVGCNAGFYSFELAKRGAEVTAIDIDPRYLRQAQWACRQFGLETQVTFRRLQVYELARDPGVYDLVWFMGVFYHLRYPLLALDILRERVGKLMVFQTLILPDAAAGPTPGDLPLHERERMNAPGWPRMAFIEHRLAGDPTNWWAPSSGAVEAMLRSSGFKVAERPAEEVYLCAPEPGESAWARSFREREMLAATGQRSEELSVGWGH
jgi:tRNA (mo5U34)-methyltransferase